MSQFSLEFKEVPKSEPDRDDEPTRVASDVGIISRCWYNKWGKCHVLSGDPEKLDCPCTYFVSFDNIAISNYDNALKSEKIKGKVKRRLSYCVGYEDMLHLTWARKKK